MDNCESLLKKALLLKPQDRFLLIDGLIRSLDEPSRKIDAIWADQIDLCPDSLYLRAASKKPEDVFPSLLRETAYA